MLANRRILTLTAALVVAAGVLLWWRTGSGDRAKTLAGRSQAAEQLGAYLAEHRPGVRVLIIGNPFTRLPGSPTQVRAYESSVIDGLRAGFGNAIEIAAVVYPDLKPGAADNPHRFGMPADATTPLSYLVTDDAFARLAHAHQADVLVSLIGIPIHLAEQPSWSDPGSPPLALYLPDLWMLGRAADIENAFTSGRVVAAVVPAPASSDTSPAFRVLSAETLRDHFPPL